MPLYEYRCIKCGAKIEVLVMPGETPVCTHCKSSALERLFSTFASPGLNGGKSSHSCSGCGSGNCSHCG